MLKREIGFHAEIWTRCAADCEPIDSIFGQIIDYAVDKGRNLKYTPYLFGRFEIYVHGGRNGLCGVGLLVVVLHQILEHEVVPAVVGVGVQLPVGCRDILRRRSVVAQTGGFEIPHALYGCGKDQSPPWYLGVEHEVGVELLVDASVVGIVEAYI